MKKIDVLSDAVSNKILTFANRKTNIALGYCDQPGTS